MYLARGKVSHACGVVGFSNLFFFFLVFYILFPNTIERHNSLIYFVFHIKKRNKFGNSRLASVKIFGSKSGGIDLLHYFYDFTKSLK